MSRCNLPLLCIAVMLISACARGPLVKEYFDNQVRELCAIDGGIKVHETVTLPADMFDVYDNPKVLIKHSPGYSRAYYVESETQDIRSETPRISRSHYKIIRRSDAKVLGESVRYSRGGGDMYGPWHDSSFICPEIGPSQPNLEKSVFLKAESK